MRRHTRSKSVGGDQENDVENNYKRKEQRRESNRKRKNFLIEYLRDYTENSNLHGLKYIGEKERTFVEKVFWLFMVICCIVLCSGLIRKVWIKWNLSPVIVSFAENTTPVWQIPYPAVTFCFETKAMQTKFNYTQYYHLYKNHNYSFERFSEDERHMYEDLSMVCDDHLAPKHNGRKFSSGAEIVENLRSVSPNLSEVVFGCKWMDTPKFNCSDLFSPIITEEGICYTYNTLGASELFRMENMHKEYAYLEHDNKTLNWTLDDGYPPSAPLETYPHRGSGFGVKSGLLFLLRTRQNDLDYLCRGPVQSFKILLHNPAELPRLSQQYFRSSLAQEVVVSVKPNMMVTSDGLKPYDPVIRQCYFPSERYLLYFKVYTQSNCEMECLSNFTNAKCGCVHFGMPHGPSVKSCNAGSLDCIKQAQIDLLTIEIESKIDKPLNDTGNYTKKAQNIARQCKCLPACTSIEYEAEISQATYDWNAVFRAHNYTPDSDNENMLYSRAMIFFKQPQFITSRRSELYGYADFLANSGGLLGLFMGFSILSVAEIVYFLTIRCFCVLSKKRSSKAKAKKIDDSSKAFESGGAPKFYVD